MTKRIVAQGALAALVIYGAVVWTLLLAAGMQ
jgi:hypothetical protein